MDDPATSFRKDHRLPHRNVFVMMRFEETPHQEQIFAAIEDALKYYGFTALRAKGRKYSTDLWQNVLTYMDGCQYGLAVFDQINTQDFNPNVSLELGYMLGLGKSCLVLKEKGIPTLPSDLSGRLYEEFDCGDIERTIKTRIRSWMRDLDVEPAEEEKTLVFVSAAGIDRCAMAKVQLQSLLASRKTGVRIRIESAGKWRPSYDRARNSGRRAIEELCGEDLLAAHRPQKLSGMLKDRADLILVMSRLLLKGLPESKTYNLKEFFGMTGNIKDPAPDNEDEASLAKYRATAQELQAIFQDEGNLQRLIEYLRD